MPDPELAEYRQALASQTINPMEVKKRIAREVIVQLYDENAARDAAEHFARVFQRREAPTDIPEVNVNQADLKPAGDGMFTAPLPALLAEAGLAASRSEARRLIQQGAVEIDDNTVTEVDARIKNGSIIKVGKHRFVRVVIPPQ